MQGLPDWIKPLLGVAVGWLLGTLTQMRREKRQRQQYQGAIYTELRDVHSTVMTRNAGIKETLEAYLRSAPIEYMPTVIDWPIFRRWFVECVTLFKESERLGLSHIYGRLESYNWVIGKVRESWDIRTGVENVDRERLRQIIQLLEGAYRDGQETAAMIAMQLQEKAAFDIRSPKTITRLEEVQRETAREMRGWLIAARQPRTPLSGASTDPTPE
jgi:hypothetical protein